MSLIAAMVEALVKLAFGHPADALLLYFHTYYIAIFQIEADTLVAGDLRTAKVLADIANDIFYYIQFTVDCPSANVSGWMPLLATEVRVAADNTIDCRFYEKPIGSKYVMMRNSAMCKKGENEYIDTRSHP